MCKRQYVRENHADKRSTLDSTQGQLLENKLQRYAHHKQNLKVPAISVIERSAVNHQGVY